MKTTDAPAATLYDTDFFEWTQQTAELIRQKRFDELDLDHLAEEIEDMGRRERREIRSRLIVLIMHLLKWRAQPHLRENSTWGATIQEQRQEIDLNLADAPSLRRDARQAIARLYPKAVLRALSEIRGTADFPAECPFTYEQIMDESFFPD